MRDNFIRRRLRKQDAVIWTISGYDDEGQVTHNTPIDMKVRVEKIRRETLDPFGNVIVTFMDINVESDVPSGSLIWLGKMEDLPTPVTDLLQVINEDEIPDAKGRKFDRWVGVQSYSGRQPVTS